MRYDFKCDGCGFQTHVDRRAFHPPREVECNLCGDQMRRVFGCQIDTTGCKDHGFIPEESRVVETDYDYNKRRGVSKEVAFDRAIKKRRSMLADGGNRGSFRHVNSVPAELYHGKIRETGDKNYWSDPKNMARHNNTKVD